MTIPIKDKNLTLISDDTLLKTEEQLKRLEAEGKTDSELYEKLKLLYEEELYALLAELTFTQRQL